jgi:hypothetical protein
VLRWLLLCRGKSWHNRPQDTDGSADGAHLIRGLARRSRSPRHIAAWTIGVVEGNRHPGAACCILCRGSSSLLVLSGSELGRNDETLACLGYPNRYSASSAPVAHGNGRHGLVYRRPVDDELVERRGIRLVSDRPTKPTFLFADPAA